MTALGLDESTLTAASALLIVGHGRLELSLLLMTLRMIRIARQLRLGLLVVVQVRVLLEETINRVILRSALLALLDTLTALFLVRRASSTHDFDGIRPIVHFGLSSLLISGGDLLLVRSTGSRVRNVVVQRRVGSHTNCALGWRKFSIRIRLVIDMA